MDSFYCLKPRRVFFEKASDCTLCAGFHAWRSKLFHRPLYVISISEISSWYASFPLSLLSELTCTYICRNRGMLWWGKNYAEDVERWGRCRRFASMLKIMPISFPETVGIEEDDVCISEPLWRGRERAINEGWVSEMTSAGAGELLRSGARGLSLRKSG